MARRHRNDGPARTQTGREVGVDAPGTCKTEKAGNGRKSFSWGRAVAMLHAVARRLFPSGFLGAVQPGCRRASTGGGRAAARDVHLRKEVLVGPVRVCTPTRDRCTLA